MSAVYSCYIPSKGKYVLVPEKELKYYRQALSSLLHLGIIDLETWSRGMECLSLDHRSYTAEMLKGGADNE